jgi:hypothetical protein
MKEMRKCNTVGDLVKLGGTSEAFLADEYDLTEELEFDSKPATKDDPPDPDIPDLILIPNWLIFLILLLLSLIQIPPLKMILLIFLLSSSSLFPDMMRIDWQ